MHIYFLDPILFFVIIDTVLFVLILIQNTLPLINNVEETADSNLLVIPNIFRLKTSLIVLIQ